MSLNELHDFMAAQGRGAIPAAQARISQRQKALAKAAIGLKSGHRLCHLKEWVVSWCTAPTQFCTVS